VEIDQGAASGEARGRAQLFQHVLQALRPIRGLPTWARYSLATVIIVAFFGLRLLLEGYFASYPFLLFFPPIILVSLALDRGSGFYSTILAAALSTRLLSDGSLGPPEIVAIAVFVAVGLFCAAVIEALRLTVDELATAEDALQRDIERRKAMEAALVESERRFRTTFEAAAVGVALVGLDGKWLQVNRCLCDLLGYAKPELLAKTFQDITHPDDLQADLAYLRQLRAGEIPSYSMEKRYYRKDGAQIWIFLTVTLVTDAAGQPQYFISVIQDIQQRKAAEAVLARDRDELARLVEERTAALMRASEEQHRAEEALRQGEKLQAVGQLTGGIAHDFNNLLQVVSGGAQLLKSPRLTEDRRSAVLDGLIHAAQSAKELTGRLLAFARRQPLRPEVFDLNTRLRAMLDPIRQALGPRFQLVTDFAPDLWPVRVDPIQLEVAVLNAAVNARDASEGAGTFTIITRNTMLGAAYEGAPAGEYVDLKMRDDGPGMPPSILSRVFEPFFTTKAPGRGTGLGLAQVHGFAKQSGGDIAIESTPGQGTTIILHLPRADPDAKDGSDRARIRVSDDLPGLMQRAAGKSILVVDDNDSVADFACSMLHELGYATKRASSGAEALEILGSSGGELDAVFSDIVMPGMTGLELASIVRARYPNVAVLLASGYSDALGSWQGERPAEVLGKPYQLLDLAAGLERSFAAAEKI
jgi:PAS domain S-box-containing protein